MVKATTTAYLPMWYGKGPGVDRSGDALRHANLAGTSPHGGVLALLGDDHTCESSTTAHQSEYAMVDAMIPVLNPPVCGNCSSSVWPAGPCLASAAAGWH